MTAPSVMHTYMYNETMGGVDLGDQLLLKFEPQFKGVKLWRKILFNLLVTASGTCTLFHVCYILLFNSPKFEWPGVEMLTYLYIQCSLGLSPPPFYRQPRLSPKFSSVPISTVKNTPLYCQTQLPPSTTGFQTQKS